MQNNRVIVLKFGSSVLSGEKDLPKVVNEIQTWWRKGNRVAAVVSAFGNTTDELTSCAHRVCSEPDDVLLASLLATGETASTTLLGLALKRAGIPVTVLNAEQAALRTIGPTLDSEPVSLDTARINEALQQSVVVLPGFVGRGRHGETTLLGRGGSDLTALFLAHQLHCHCRLVKDVDGLYTADPNAITGKHAKRFAQISYVTARKIGGDVVQLKTIDFAERHGLSFTVSNVGSTGITEVGPFQDYIEIDEIVLFNEAEAEERVA
jgi:homoserine dehydrogenase